MNFITSKKKKYQAEVKKCSFYFLFLFLLCIFYCHLSIIFLSPQAKKKICYFLREMRPYILQLWKDKVTFSENPLHGSVLLNTRKFIVLLSIFREVIFRKSLTRKCTIRIRIAYWWHINWHTFTRVNEWEDYSLDLINDVNLEMQFSEHSAEDTVDAGSDSNLW